MGVVEEFVKANEQYAARFRKGHLPMPPAWKVAVVACMDARLDPARLLGLEEGDAHVIRNAGGRAGDALRSLVISQQLLGTREVVIIHHTDCGMSTFTDSDLRHKLSRELSQDTDISFLAFTDLEQSLRDDISELRRSPLLLKVPVRGFIYEVKTGLLREVTAWFVLAWAAIVRCRSCREPSWSEEVEVRTSDSQRFVVPRLIRWRPPSMLGGARLGVALFARTCNLCEAMCGLMVEVAQGRIGEIRGDPEDPLSRGYLCPKALGLKDVQEDPDRLRRPLRRKGNAWEEVSWDEAFQEAAERLALIQKQHGRNAVAVYQGNPLVHNYAAALMSQAFVKALRTRSLYSATSVDQLPHMVASFLMFGHQLLLPVPDVDHTDFFLIFGANPLVSNGSLMTAPGIGRRLKNLRERGGRLVVVDPRRTQTAALADTHFAIPPGADAHLLLALLHVLFDEGLVNPGRLGSFTDRVDFLAEAVSPFTPEAVAPRLGLEPNAIRQLARDFGRAPRAVAYGRVGVSTQEFGGICCWLITALNVVTGNLDRPGGALFPSPAVDLVKLASRIGLKGHFDKGRSRVRGLPEFGGEYPAATLADEIETEGAGQVKALVTIAGNPVLSTPNGARLEAALSKLEFTVSVDYYLNETTRHAHLLLPPTAALEHDHYDLVFHMLAVRNTAKYSPALVDPAPGTLQESEILLELARRLTRAKGGSLRTRAGHAVLRGLGPTRILDLLLRFGGRRLSLAALRRSPHGIDLGPLEPRLPRLLHTKTRRIDVAPERFLGDLTRLQEAPTQTGLVLIGRRDLLSNNSWMHNSLRLVKGKNRCTLLMHPEDARDRGLAGGETVRVTSRVGVVDVPVEVTSGIRQGVVSLPHGFGHSRPGMRLAVASTHAGASLNDLTDEARVDGLCGTAAFSGTPVSVARV